MKKFNGATSETRKSGITEGREKGPKRDSNVQEFRGGVAAILTVVIGVSLVVILQKVLSIEDSAIIVALLIVPILVYGVISGRLSELQGPGGWGAKFNQRLIELSDKVQETEGIVSHAFQQASVASIPNEMESRAIHDPEQEMEKLIAQYKDTREKMEYGWERTMNMTSIVQRMIPLAPQLAHFDIDGYLDSEDQGERLAAYTYLYAKPQYEDDRFRKLVDSVSTTILRYKAFEQYWGLQAISRNLPQEEDEKLSSKVKTDLQSFAQRLPGKTDRDYLLRTILSRLED